MEHLCMLNVVLLCVARISWRFNSMILIEFENFLLETVLFGCQLWIDWIFINLHCFLFWFWIISTNTKSPWLKSSEIHFHRRKIIIYFGYLLILRLAFTSFQTTPYWLQQIKLTWPQDPIEKQQLVSGHLQKTQDLNDF